MESSVRKQTYTYKRRYRKVSLKFPKRTSNIYDSHDGTEFVSKTFIDFLEVNNIKQCSRNRSTGGVFPEGCIRTITDVLEKPLLKKKKLTG